MAGAEGLEPTALGFGVREKSISPHFIRLHVKPPGYVPNSDRVSGTGGFMVSAMCGLI